MPSTDRTPTATPAPPAPQAPIADASPSHFARIGGGGGGVARLVEAFYAQMDTLPEARGIRAMHPPDLAPVKEVLTRYLGEWLGGPPLYSSERGHPRLRRRHGPFPIGVAERDAWMLCMTRALDQVVADESLRTALTRAFFGLADFIRNDTTGPHA